MEEKTEIKDKKKSFYIKLIIGSVIWLLLVPVSISLHNVFSGMFGESSLLSLIFFSLSLILILGSIIPVVVVVASCAKLYFRK